VRSHVFLFCILSLGSSVPLCASTRRALHREDPEIHASHRSDLFNGISEKSKGDMDGIATYARTYNQLIGEAQKKFGVQDRDSGMLVHKENGETLLPIREILFSGGDALTLPNSTIARYLAMMAESGLKTVRFGTKEFIFNPSRFDANFFSMLDDFHEAYPDMRVEVVGHYTHPFGWWMPKQMRLASTSTTSTSNPRCGPIWSSLCGT
jgi:hypothetical protein